MSADTQPLTAMELDNLAEMRAKSDKSDGDRVLLHIIRKLVAENTSLRAELTEHLETILHSEGILIKPPDALAGWWDSAANSIACEAGDRLVDLNLYERHTGGIGRRQFYREKEI